MNVTTNEPPRVSRARTAEQLVIENIGTLTIACARLQAENERLREQLAELEAAAAQTKA